MEAARRGPARRGRGRPRHPELERLERMAAARAASLDGFVGGNRFPLVERDAVTFVFRGEADAVYLRHFMHGETDGLPFERLDGTDLWHLRLPVPKGLGSSTSSTSCATGPAPGSTIP